MEIDQWVEAIKSIMGSKETIQVVLQGAEFAVQRSDSAVLSHFWASLRRWREGIPNPFWEAIGGIVFNITTNEMIPDMQDVPSSTLRILSSVSERGCNSMVQGSRKFLDISVGSG